MLARAGCPLDARDGAGETAVHVALRAGALELAASLVECGARLNVPDAAGRTPLWGVPRVAQHAVLARVADAPDWTSPHQRLSLGGSTSTDALTTAGATPAAGGRSMPPAPVTDACQECDAPFELARRRHHCRHCGRALCATCSADKSPIAKFGLSAPVRVCEPCKHILTSTS